MTLKPSFDPGVEEETVVVVPPEVQVLERAAQIVRSGWTRHAEARDKLGNQVMVDSPDATQFCAIGAIQRATDDLGYGLRERQKAYGRLKPFTGSVVPWWNDNIASSSADVAEAMERAARS